MELAEQIDVVGLGGFAGGMGGVAFQRLIGYVLQQDPRAYGTIFMVCGVIYVIALALMHSLAPRMEPVNLTASSR